MTSEGKVLRMIRERGITSRVMLAGELRVKHFDLISWIRDPRHPNRQNSIRAAFEANKDLSPEAAISRVEASLRNLYGE